MKRLYGGDSMSDFTLALLSTLGSLTGGLVLGLLACWMMTTND